MLSIKYTLIPREYHLPFAIFQLYDIRTTFPDKLKTDQLLGLSFHVETEFQYYKLKHRAIFIYTRHIHFNFALRYFLSRSRFISVRCFQRFQSKLRKTTTRGFNQCPSVAASKHREGEGSKGREEMKNSTRFIYRL